MAFENKKKAQAYWRSNIKLMTILMMIWFVVSFVFGVLLIDQLNTIRIGGYKLGFWFAQQGSIYTFVVLIFIYAKKMSALDKKYGVHDE